MKFTELKASIEEGAKPIYLLEGNDAYFRQKAEAMIKEAFLENAELNFSSFDGETLKGGGLSALSSAVENFPFMAERRVVKVTELHPSDTEYEGYLKKLFEDFPPTGLLIIVNTPSKKGVDLKRKKSVCYVDCNSPDLEQAAKWIYITLRRAGVASHSSTCENIASYCRCDMSRIAVEVQKIIDYKQGGELTDAEADDLVYKDAEYRLYELSNTIARRDFTNFNLILEELLKKSGDENFVLNGLNTYFRNLLTCATSTASDADIAALLKMKEYGVKKSREQAHAIGVDKTARLARYIYSQISAIKSGVITPSAALLNCKNTIFFDNGQN